MTKRKSANLDAPIWFDGTNINEALFCDEFLNSRKIIFADVPRNPTGKIEKPKLREKYGATHLVAAQNQG